MRNRTGQYVILRSSDGNIEHVNFGIQNVSSGDFLVPGDYDGDGMTDFGNVRVNSGVVEGWILERDGGFAQANWGTTNIAGASEFLAQGDYDGDGATDIAIWRRNNSDSNDDNFFVRRSSDGALQSFEWGDVSDTPINAWNTQ